MLRLIFAFSLAALPAFGSTISIGGSDSFAFGKSWNGGGPSLVTVSAGNCSPVCATIDYYNAINAGPGFTVSSVINYADARISTAWNVVVSTTTNLATGTNDFLKLFGVSLPSGYTISGTSLDQRENSSGQIVLEYRPPFRPDPNTPTTPTTPPVEPPIAAPLPASGFALGAAILGLIGSRRRKRRA